VRSDDDEVSLASEAARLTDVLRRRRAPVDCNASDGNTCKLKGLFVEQPNPMLAGARGERFAQAEIMISVHCRKRSDVRRRQTGEHMSEIAWVRELDAVAQKENQVGLSLGKPLERRVGAPVEVLGLEDVDPA
jgi:hypothetical protein